MCTDSVRPDVVIFKLETNFLRLADKDAVDQRCNHEVHACDIEHQVLPLIVLKAEKQAGDLDPDNVADVAASGPYPRDDASTAGL